MVIGGLGAIAQHDVKRILSFHIISQIGYMILGLALFTVVGIAGAIFHIVHNVVVKTTLFLSGGLIEHHGGSSRLDRLSGMVRSAPVIAVLFLLPALSLAGIPPLSGFGAKFALLDASVRSSYWTALAAGIVVSFLTLFSMIKIWVGVFWAPEGDPDLDAPAPGAGEPTRSPGIGGPVLMVAPTAALVVITIAMGIFAGPFLELTTRAAGDLLDPTPYLDAVASAGGGS
jgi:multicomponent Na+:H+ antiporter subunit D